LDDLVPAPLVVFGKSETISADHSSVLENHVVSQTAVLTDNGVRMRKEAMADLSTFIDDSVRKYYGVVSDHGITPDAHIWTNVGILAESCRLVDHGRTVDPRRISWHLIKKLERLCECKIGVLRAQRGGGSSRQAGEILAHQNGRRIGGLRCGKVFRIRNKGDLGCAGCFDASHAGDFRISGCRRDGVQPRPQRSCDL
jgi:hypothetical protein